MEAAAITHPGAADLGVARPRLSERRIAFAFAGSGIAIFAVMGLVGLAMRLTQADVLGISPSWFYRLLTLHGAGMLTGALLVMMGGLWYVVRPVVPLDLERMVVSLGSILLGAVLVIVSTVIGGFGTGWTFLSPLPFYPAGQWHTWATVTYLLGLLLVGVGFFVFCLDVTMRVTATYGGLSRSLGIPFLRGRDDSPPPPQVLAAIVVALEGMLASAAGTTVVVAMIGRTMDSGMELNALWAKNLIYFYGHSVANLIIYLAAGMIYVLLPRYAGRPWKTTKPIVVGWLFTLVFVTTAYSHHLYMDFVQPGGLQLMSTLASFGASIPVAVVTIYTGMMLVWGSKYRWTLASNLIYLGFAGWLIGGAAAVMDSIIPLNFRFHNTLWVAAHFHTYLLMCVIFWALAFFAYLLEQAAGRTAPARWTAVSLGAMAVGGYGFVGMWYLSGVLGVPRRYAVEPAGTVGYSVAGSIFVIVFAIGFLVLLVEFLQLALAARARERTSGTLAGGGDGSGVGEGAGDGAGNGDAGEERERPLVEAPEPDGVPLATGPQLGLALGAAIVSIFAFLPPVTRAAETSTQYHHLQHAVQYLFGVLLGLLVMSAPGISRRLGRRAADLGIAAVIAAPAIMLLLMVPSIYEPLEEHPFDHFLYHVAVAGLGFVTGLGAGAIGRVTGRIAVVLTVGMALMYAAGVSGG